MLSRLATNWSSWSAAQPEVSDVSGGLARPMHQFHLTNSHSQAASPISRNEMRAKAYSQSHANPMAVSSLQRSISRITSFLTAESAPNQSVWDLHPTPLQLVRRSIIRRKPLCVLELESIDLGATWRVISSLNPAHRVSLCTPVRKLLPIFNISICAKSNPTLSQTSILIHSISSALL